MGWLLDFELNKKLSRGKTALLFCPDRDLVTARYSTNIQIDKPVWVAYRQPFVIQITAKIKPDIKL